MNPACRLLSMSRLFRFLFSLETELPSDFQELCTSLRHFVLFSPFEFWVFCFFLVVTTCILRARSSARIQHEGHRSGTSSPSSNSLPSGFFSRSDYVLSHTKHRTSTGLAMSAPSPSASSQCTLRETTPHSPMLNHSSFPGSTKWHQDTLARKTQVQTQDPSPRRSPALNRGTPPRNLGGVLYQDKQREDLLLPMSQKRDLEYLPPRFHRSRRKRDLPPQRRAQKLAPLDTQSRFHNNSPFNIPIDDPPPKQPYDAFLVLDIEGTCQLGTDFNYPNEIIEFPVCLVQWVDKTDDGRACELKVVDEFRSFVKPTWRPVLSDFCKNLTGITQDQVDSAPYFPEVLTQLEAFLVKHGLIDKGTGQCLKKFSWCSDGPCDIRDFVVKQCFISKVKMPSWLARDVLDIRSTMLQYLSYQPPWAPETPRSSGLTCRSLNISAQLKVLGLPAFEGREHSGIDDTRNVSRVLIELARRGMCLLPNTTIHPSKRWLWMGKDGQILDELLTKL